MYKNFNLTESEREQILKQHKKYGYKNPLNEQYEDESMGDDTNDGSEQDMGSSSYNLKVDDSIFIPVEGFTVYVSYTHEDGYDEVDVRVNQDEDGNPVFDVNDALMPEGGNPEDFINAIKQKMGDNPFESLKYHGAVLNYETGETENY